VNTLVIDASIAIKWVVEEDGTAEALVLRQKAKLIAPDLLVAECANIFWKKVQRGEFLKAKALFAPLVCFRAPKLPTRSLMMQRT
jgi:predicted nucleic acid-binding protein